MFQKKIRFSKIAKIVPCSLVYGFFSNHSILGVVVVVDDDDDIVGNDGTGPNFENGHNRTIGRPIILLIGNGPHGKLK